MSLKRFNTACKGDILRRPSGGGSLRLILLSATVVILLFSKTPRAETLEEVINPRNTANGWVSDMAGLLDGDSEAELAREITQLETQTGTEIAVVTIRQTDGRSAKAFATALFNRWGIGKKEQDNGILILVVRESREIEVETGYGVEGALPDGKIGEILDRRVVPQFRRGDYDAGLLAGVRSISEALRRDPSAALPQQRSPSGPSFPFWDILILLVFFGVVIYLIRRNRVHRCPKCGKKMRLLTPKQEKAYLSVDQNFEEELGSINYRVWRCDDCQTVEVQRKLRSGYYACPKCRHRTLQLHSYILQEPTYLREGLRELKQECRRPQCDFKVTKRQRLPRRVPPRPRKPGSVIIGGFPNLGGSRGGFGRGGFGGGFGGGSFGGGGSGGGGAGRSW